MLKAGVIGAGILGSQHARFMYDHAQVELSAVADLRLAAAETVAHPLGARAFGSAQEMLTAETLDLVVVATPDPYHVSPSLAALGAGVPNIIQEKPLATTVAEAERLYEAIEQAGARFYVNYANRAAMLDVATGYVVQQGLLGEVVYGESRLDDNISVPTTMWGPRSRAWAQGSSTAHFLLSHVVDLLRWYFAPAEVTEVYAISQQRVLESTPDVYDAFLTFDSGLKVRVKAEWIKHIDELVEFYMCFSGSQGTLIYNKRGGFGTEAGWRANLRTDLTTEELLTHREALAARGANVKALVHQPAPATATLEAGGVKTMRSLEFNGLGYGDTMALEQCFVASILDDTLMPDCWLGHGPLPTHLDGLEQTRIIEAIVTSAETGRVVSLTR